MRNPGPLPALASAAAWTLGTAFLFPWIIPPVPSFRTAVAAGAVLLFSAALAVPRAAFVLALASVSCAGVSALVFSLPEPVPAGVVLAGGYFAGATLRSLYEMDAPRPHAPLLPAWRSMMAAWGVSGLSAFVTARSSYLLVRDVPPPRIVNVLGLDASSAIAGIAAAVAAMLVAGGFHRAALATGRDPAGRRAIDLALLASAALPGAVAVLQKLGAVPIWRSARWGEGNRTQALFTDPSAAGVAAALLLAPLLARAFAGSVRLRLAAGASALLLVPLAADSGSRAGLVGAVTAAALLILSLLTRVAAGTKPGLRRRLVGSAGAAAILLALAFAAALAWPSPGSESSPLLARIRSSLSSRPSPSEDPARRLVLYQAALVLYSERPFAGGGVGSYAVEMPNVAAERLGRPVESTDHPPSFYLGVLAESGSAGALLLTLLLVGIIRGAGGGLAMAEPRAEESLRAAGAGAATFGLLVVFLFGSHLVYPEIAAIFGVLTTRLPVRPEGKTNRLLAALVPVVTAGSLVVLLAGILARAYESWTPAAAFARSRAAGVYPAEREPDGREFRWTSRSAAFLVETPGAGPASVTLPLRNARPDGGPVTVDVLWNDQPRLRSTLRSEGWREVSVPVSGPGVLRVVPSVTFRPVSGPDARTLGVETGAPRAASPGEESPPR